MRTSSWHRLATAGALWWVCTASVAASLVDITRPGDPISSSGAVSSPDEQIANAIDNKLDTKFYSGTAAIAFTVTPAQGPSVLVGVRFGTANDFPDRDPITIEIQGSNDGGATWSNVIQNISTGLDADPGRETYGAVSRFVNTASYTSYLVILKSVRSGPAVAPNRTVHFSEVELFQDTGPATGPSFTVTTVDENNDGACTAEHCTLIEALNAANASFDANNINFAAGLSGEIRNTLTPAGLLISTPVTIAGPGARVLSVSGNDKARVFRVSPDGVVTISGLTITRGAINDSGAGIANSGTLTLIDCAVVKNVGGSGAGVLNTGTLHVTNCTLAENNSTGHGAALRNVRTMTVTNSTIANNTGVSSAAITSFVNDGPPATVTLTNCTISGNNATAADGVGGLLNGNASTMTLRNTIVAFNTRPGNAFSELSGSFQSGGNNFIRFSSGSTGFADGPNGDQVGGGTASAPAKDPKLDTLKNNGGPTDTMALLSDSTAGDAANNANAPTRDQRGYFRSGVSDIGAFEFAGVVPTAPTVTTSAATNVGTSSATLNVSVNPNGTATTFQFTSDAGAFPVQEVGSGNAGVPFSVTVTGLNPNTTYRFNATATSAAGTTQGTEQTFTTLPATRLANIATRLRVETGNNVLIGGFIVTGSTEKRLLLRAVGPSLPLDDRLQNPLLELYNGSGELIASNDNWQDAPNRQEIIDSTIPPSHELESAILQNVNVGAYTAIVSGIGEGTGVGLVEVYDLGSTQNAKLANIATRGRVQAGENVMIGGLIVTGVGAQKVIVRAIGPSLDVEGRLEDPALELYDANGALIHSNDNWRDTQQAEIEATTIPPPNELESAIVQTLAPAAYTAIVRGVNDGIGVAVVEVYAIQ